MACALKSVKLHVLSLNLHERVRGEGGKLTIRESFISCSDIEVMALPSSSWITSLNCTRDLAKVKCRHGNLGFMEPGT